MADQNYSIPWKPLDLSPGAAMLIAVNNANQQDERSREYLDMEKEAVRQRSERESAALARQKKQDEEQDRIRAWTALPGVVAAQRAHGTGFANQNPYGFKFDEQASQEQPPEFRMPESPPVETNPPEPKFESLPPGVEGPEQRLEPPSTASTDELMQQARPEQPLDMMTQAAMAAAGVGPKEPKLFATFNGNRFEIPENHQSTGFGQSYDELHDHLMSMPGMTEAKALSIVAAKQKADMAEQGRNTREADVEKGRNARAQTYHLTREDIMKQFQDRLAQSEKNARIGAGARMASAGAAPVSPNVSVLIGMKEAGASDQEIFDKAAEMKVPEKQFIQPIQNVVRNAAAGERAGQKREQLTATDETGKSIGVWKSPQAATVGTKQIESFAQARTRLRALIDDIKASGSRVLTPDEIQNRLSKAQSVAAAMRVYNDLGATDASQRLESDIMGAIGAPGHGWLMGANLGVVERILDEAEKQHQVQLNTKLRPGGGSHLAPALGGPRQSGGGQVDAARKWLTDNPTADPALRAKVEAKIQQLEGGGG